MSEIKKVFDQLKLEGEGALIGYTTGGDPSLDATIKIAESLVKGGVDILELGIPFSDPIADGPTIQAASLRALNARTTPTKVMGMSKEIKQKCDVPIVILTYYNPIFKMGLEKFFKLAKENRIDGIVIPDLPIEEATEYHKIASNSGVDTIFLAAPSTSEKRLAQIVACTSGFLYLVSHFGVTGALQELEDSTIQLIKRVLPYTHGKIPLAVGFGVSKPLHVRNIIKTGADGAIVGSAFVKIVEKHKDNQQRMLAEIQETAKELKKATKIDNLTQVY